MGRGSADWPLLEPAPRVAFLDVDGTLLPRTTAFLFAGHLRRKGMLDRRVLVWSCWQGLRHRMGGLDYARLVRTSLNGLSGHSYVTLERLAYESFVEHVKPNLYEGVVEHLASLRRAGTALVLISSSPGFVIAPLGVYLGCDDVVATPLVIERDRIRGVGSGPLCYGDGKCYWAELWARVHGIAMDESAAYADNWSDRALLKSAGRAVVVWPGRRLARLARERGWTVIRPAVCR